MLVWNKREGSDTRLLIEPSLSLFGEPPASHSFCFLSPSIVSVSSGLPSGRRGRFFPSSGWRCPGCGLRFLVLAAVVVPYRLLLPRAMETAPASNLGSGAHLTRAAREGRG